MKLLPAGKPGNPVYEAVKNINAALDALKLDAGANVGSESRMIVQSAKAIVFFLPRSYRERLAAVPGVAAVTFADWFGGVYQDPKNFFASFAADAESYLEMYKSDLELPADQKATFLRERTACVVGQHLMDKFGWRLGQEDPRVWPLLQEFQ